MIPVYKLERLPAGQRRRKLALLLANCERKYLLPDSERGFDEAYLRELIRLSLEDPAIDPTTLAGIRALDPAAGEAAAVLRFCNQTRHALLAAIGTFPAEWDLVFPEERAHAAVPAEVRRFFPGVMAYAEDIRSPFNLGSIFRTAEAFGAERLFLSPLCVPAEHPRAQRSAMGCTEFLPWERRAVGELPDDMPVFALETGGTPIDEFDFPDKGIVIVGSEELGVSPEGLARATYGRVSIPMTGVKASLNVGVAFGILMQAWTGYLGCSDSNPA